MTITPTNGFVPGVKVGFGPHPAKDVPKQPTSLPGEILDQVPAGPLKYRAGDPLALVTLSGKNGTETIEAYTQWKNGDDLIQAGDTLRGALKTAFQRAKDGQAQAVIHDAKEGQYWLARLAGADQKPVYIDGKSVKGISVMGTQDERDVLAIIGPKAVINFSDENIRKPRWWDPIFS
jgi:hypothetical protein